MAGERFIPTYVMHTERFPTLPELSAVLRFAELPDPSQFPESEIAAVRAILPEYHGESLTPQFFYPQTFEDLIAKREELRQGKYAVNRGHEGNSRYAAYIAALKEKGINVNDHIQRTIIKDAAAVLCLDDFPSQLPENVSHYNLWFARDPDDEAVVAATVQYSINFLRVTTDDLVIVEKKRAAREDASEYIPGRHPSVRGFRHLHLLVNME